MKIFESAQPYTLLIKVAISAVFVIAIMFGCYALAMKIPSQSSDYVSNNNNNNVSSTLATSSLVIVSSIASSTPVFVATHISTPSSVKGIYMSSWVAGTPSFRAKLVNFLDTTEANTIVIDVKDSTGKISFEVDDPSLVKVGSVEKRIPDIKEFIATLHSKGIYVIGRIATFQDPFFVKLHPEYAVKTKTGAVWQDHKGVTWLDVGAEPVWEYVTTLGKQAYAYGFDEINFDYIRFPSDGDMSNIAYPYSEGKVKSEVLNNFFTYVDNVFRPLGIPTSMDIFGETTSAKDDLGIGQVIEDALAHFNYVMPMVYPSHFALGFNGWKVPAAEPYNIIIYSMTRAVSRAHTLATATSTITKKVVGTTTVTTVSPVTPPEHVGELRPWLQDFSLGATPYTPLMVRQQIQATYDSGLNSWMLWNAANKYDAAAMLGLDDTLSTSTFFATTSASVQTYASR